MGIRSGFLPGRKSAVSAVECHRRPDQIICVLHACCLIWRVHGELGQADIHCIERDLCVRDAAKGRTACHIRAVGKCLYRYACGAADITEHCSRNCQNIGTSCWIYRPLFPRPHSHRRRQTLLQANSYPFATYNPC